MIIRIIEEFWLINRRTGMRTVKESDHQVFPAEVGSELKMETGRRVFLVEAVSDTQVVLSVVYANNPDANETWTIIAGESVVYRPKSFDGGYRYTISYENH